VMQPIPVLLDQSVQLDAQAKQEQLDLLVILAQPVQPDQQEQPV